MDKKGFYRISDSIMLFLSFLVVGVCVAISLYLFFGSQTEISSVEAKILAEKLTRAFIEQGHFHTEALTNNFNLYKEAGIVGSVIKNGDFYYIIKVYNLSEGTILKTFVDGNYDLGVLCEIAGKNNPSCFYTELIADNYHITILSAVRQEGAAV